MLSLHYFYGERWADAWRTSIAAGERAQAKFANVEAAEFYARALEAARRLRDVPAEERARIWEARGDVCELAGLYAEAIDAYRNARRAATVAAPAAQGGERSASAPATTRARCAGTGAGSRGGGDGRAASSSSTCASATPATRYRQGHFADAIRWARDAVELAHELDYLPGLAHGVLPPPHRAHRDRAPGPRRVPRARAADLRGARRPARPGARPQQPRHRGVLRGPLGRGARPLRAQQGGADADRRRRQRRARREQHRRDPQRPGPARGGAGAVRGIARRRGPRRRTAHRRRRDAQPRPRWPRAKGRFDEAQTLVAEALAALEALDSRNFVLEAEARLAEVTAAAGDAEEGLRLANEALAHASDVDAPAARRRDPASRPRARAARPPATRPQAVASFEASLDAARGVGRRLRGRARAHGARPGRRGGAVLARLGVHRLGPV